MENIPTFTLIIGICAILSNIGVISVFGFFLRRLVENIDNKASKGDLDQVRRELTDLRLQLVENARQDKELRDIVQALASEVHSFIAAANEKEKVVEGLDEMMTDKRKTLHEHGNILAQHEIRLERLETAKCQALCTAHNTSIIGMQRDLEHLTKTVEHLKTFHQ